MRTTTGTSGRNDVGLTIAIHITGSYAHASCEERRVGEKTLQRLAGLAIKHAHQRRRATIRTNDDVGYSIAINVSRRHKHTAAEKSGISKEAGDGPAKPVTDASIKDADECHHAGSGCSNNVGNTITIHVADGDAHATLETVPVGLKAEGFGSLPGVYGKLHDRRMSCAGSCNYQQGGGNTTRRRQRENH